MSNNSSQASQSWLANPEFFKRSYEQTGGTDYSKTHPEFKVTCGYCAAEVGIESSKCHACGEFFYHYHA